MRLLSAVTPRLSEKMLYAPVTLGSSLGLMDALAQALKTPKNMCYAHQETKFDTGMVFLYMENSSTPGLNLAMSAIQKIVRKNVYKTTCVSLSLMI